MTKRKSETEEGIHRRDLLAAGTGAMAALAATTIGCAHKPKAGVTPGPAAGPAAAPPPKKPTIGAFRTLGRTGFRVSDIALGCGRLSDSNVVRYAFERGINFFDTAEGYGNGDSERKIGAALVHIPREKVFIATKLKVKKGESAASLIARFAACQQRLKTKYIDALYMHSVTKVADIGHAGFHQAVKQLKAEGRLKHAGISSHGPRGAAGESMEQVMLAAVADGRFDLTLFTYNLMNQEAAHRILAACKAKNVGTTAMKTKPSKLESEPFDAKNPSAAHRRMLGWIIKRGATREQAIEQLKKRLAFQRQRLARYAPQIAAFKQKYGVVDKRTFDLRAVSWVLQNPEMQTVCVSMPDFAEVDSYLPLSGKKLTADAAAYLRDYAQVFDDSYCRQGCTACAPSCPRDIAVSTVMRYAYYFLDGREKQAMEKYAALGAPVATACLECSAPCRGSCPHGLDVPEQLLHADELLTLA